MNTARMKLIGKGAFSSVYQKSKDKVIIKSKDTAKLCMAEGFFPSTPMFPVITKIGTSDCGEYTFYESKYYEKAGSLKKNLTAFEYEFYKELRKITEGSGKCPSVLIDRISSKFGHKRSMIQTAYNGLRNYGNDIYFEISPRNVSTRNGRLVLLDCFFFMSELNKVRGW